jgi:hypothetical protein
MNINSGQCLGKRERFFLFFLNIGSQVAMSIFSKPNAVKLYNDGVQHFHNGRFEAALSAFQACFETGEYQMQAVYGKVVCQNQLGREIQIPPEIEDQRDDIMPIALSSNLACYLIGEGHKAVLKQGSPSSILARVNGSTYVVALSNSFGGQILTNAWRNAGGKQIPIGDPDSNPTPTQSDGLIMSLLQQVFSMPPFPLPDGGLQIATTI